MFLKEVNVDRFRNLWSPGSAVQKTLADYIEAMPPENGEYLFDTGEFLAETGLDRGWKTAPVLRDTGMFKDTSQEGGIITIAMGGDRQGIPFHWHGDAYSVQVTTHTIRQLRVGIHADARLVFSDRLLVFAAARRQALGALWARSDAEYRLRALGRVSHRYMILTQSSPNCHL